jgi:hypothetical protein
MSPAVVSYADVLAGRRIVKSDVSTLTRLWPPAVLISQWQGAHEQSNTPLPPQTQVSSVLLFADALHSPRPPQVAESGDALITYMETLAAYMRSPEVQVPWIQTETICADRTSILAYGLPLGVFNAATLDLMVANIVSLLVRHVHSRLTICQVQRYPTVKSWKVKHEEHADAWDAVIVLRVPSACREPVQILVKDLEDLAQATFPRHPQIEVLAHSYTRSYEVDGYTKAAESLAECSKQEAILVREGRDAERAPGFDCLLAAADPRTPDAGAQPIFARMQIDDLAALLRAGSFGALVAALKTDPRPGFLALRRFLHREECRAKSARFPGDAGAAWDARDTTWCAGRDGRPCYITVRLPPHDDE